VLTEYADLTRQSLPEIPTTCPQLIGRIGIWIHADDLCLENSPLAALRAASVAAFTSAETYARYGLSERRIQSIRTALRDGLTRGGTHFDRATSLSDTPSTADGIKAWVEGEKLDAVIAMNDALGIPRHLAALKEADIPLLAKAACLEAETGYPVPRYMSRAECEAIIRRVLPPQDSPPAPSAARKRAPRKKAA
jgi:hypothetical protein